jgi:hypothetical protein
MGGGRSHSRRLDHHRNKSTQEAQMIEILNFSQAAAALEYKHKQPEPQTLKMTRCHDGVHRCLIEAPKFKSGGFTSTSRDAEYLTEWLSFNLEHILNQKRKG